jgi:hypothetical protein
MREGERWPPWLYESYLICNKKLFDLACAPSLLFLDLTVCPFNCAVCPDFPSVYFSFQSFSREQSGQLGSHFVYLFVSSLVPLIRNLLRIFPSPESLFKISSSGCVWTSLVSLSACSWSSLLSRGQNRARPDSVYFLFVTRPRWCLLPTEYFHGMCSGSSVLASGIRAAARELSISEQRSVW